MRLDRRMTTLEQAAATRVAAEREAEVAALLDMIPTADLRLLLAASRARREGRPLTAEERDVLDRHAPALARLVEMGAV